MVEPPLALAQQGRSREGLPLEQRREPPARRGHVDAHHKLREISSAAQRGMRMFWRWSQRKARAAGRKLQELRLEPRPNILPLSRQNLDWGTRLFHCRVTGEGRYL